VDRFDELLSDYLDGALDAAGRDELASLIDSDSARRETFVSMVREHRLLVAELGDPAADPFARRVMSEVDKGRTQFVRAVMADVKGPGSGGKRPPSPLPRRTFRPRGDQGPGWVLWASLAAGLLVVIAILLSISGGEEPSKPDRKTARETPKPAKQESAPEHKPELVQKPDPRPLPKPELPSPPSPGPRETPAPVVIRPEPKASPEPIPPVAPPKAEASPSDKTPATIAEIAKLEFVEGEVTLGDAAARTGPLSPGFLLDVKDEKSSAVVRYPDGTKVEFGGISRAQDEPNRPGHVLSISGLVTAEVAKQLAEKPMIFITAHAEARVLGTKLRIDTANDSTRLDVTEGRVRLTRLRDKATVEVVSGHYAIAAASGSMTSRLARASTGLVALYTFKEGKGGVVHDASRAGAPLDLKIENEAAVKWSAKGLLIGSPVLISSTASATKIVQACKASNEVTVEAWIRPGTLAPAGKDGRIVDLSADTMNQNFLLGQDELKGPVRAYFMRLRTTATDLVGKPALATPDNSAALKLSHLVYARSAAGIATFYIDGVDVARTTGGGALSTWNEAYRLSVGNELTGDRPWLGEVHLVAVYSRALAADEVKQNFKAGME
jgi:hypothetical protein